MKKIIWNKYNRSLLLTLLFICVIFSYTTNANASPKPIKPTTVILGTYEVPGLCTKNQDGTYSGLYIDYFNMLSQFTNWEVVNKDISVKDRITKTEINDVDVLCCTFKTKETNNLLFSDVPMGYSYKELLVQTEDNLSFDKTISVGTINTNNHIDAFKKFASENNIKYKIIVYNTPYELKEALFSSKVDTIISESIATIDGTNIISEFDPKPYFIATCKDNSLLMKTINDSMYKLNHNFPTYVGQLLEKYSKTKTSQINFTSAEKDFIRNTNSIDVLISKNRFPYEYADELGKPKGISYEILKKIEINSGLKFNYILVDDYSKLSSNMLFVSNSPNQYNSKFINTPTFATTNYLLVGKKNTIDKKDKTIALSKDDTVKDIAFSNVENVSTFIDYDTTSGCLDSVISNDADFTILNEYEIGYYKNIPKYKNLETTQIPNMDFKEAIALTKNSDNNLYTIITKSLNNIPKSYIESVTYTYTNLSPTLTLISKIKNSPFVFASIIFFFTIIIAGLAFTVFYNRQMKNKNASLEKMNKKLVNSSREKDRFMSQVSHDMRTPLNGIIGLLDLSTTEDISKEELIDNLNMMRASGNFLENIINDLLEITRLTNDKILLNLESININRVIDDIINNNILVAKNKEINFTYTVNFSNAWVKMDKLKFMQILNNLLSNAFKFTPSHGKVNLSANIISDKDNYTTFEFIVKDNGIGISKDAIDKIFEPFFQENDMSFDSIGTGLGLNIVKRMVTLMNGEVNVNSKKYKGSEFKLLLTFLNSKPITSFNSIETDNIKPLIGKRVLLFEDNKVNITIIKKALENLGMIVDYELNGKAGLEKYLSMDSNYYSIILTDIRMPVMDGLEASIAIRSSRKSDSMTIPIIAISANAFEEDIQKSKNAGINSHISKPINLNILKKELIRLLIIDKEKS